MGPFRFALVVLALGLLLGASTAALGAPSPPPPKRTDTPRPTTKRPKQQITVVLLVEKSEARARNTLVQSIRSQLSDTAVKLDLQSVDRFAAELSRQLAIARKAATRSRSRVVIWFSLTRAEPLYLYFVEPKGTRLIMRNFGEMDADERAEAAALVVRSSVLAFLRGEPLGRKVTGPTRPAVKRPRPPVKRAAPPAPRRLWTALELGYAWAYDSWGTDLLGAHGLQARVAVHLIPRLSLLVGYQWCQPLTMPDAEGHAELELRMHRLSLGARYRHPFGRWEVGASLLLSADYVDYGISGAQINDNNLRPLFLMSLIGALHVGFRVVDRFRLQVELGVEMGLYNPTLRLEISSQPPTYSEFGKSGVARPRVLFGLAVDLI